MLSTKHGETILHTGDTIDVHSTVVEGSKQRVQVFGGILLAISGRAENQMITVRRVSTGGYGVERQWPVNARSIVKIVVKKNANKIRRSKLYYLRNLTGRQAARI